VKNLNPREIHLVNHLNVDDHLEKKIEENLNVENLNVDDHHGMNQNGLHHLEIHRNVNLQNVHLRSEGHHYVIHRCVERLIVNFLGVNRHGNYRYCLICDQTSKSP
jgi:hypothetical protein